MIVARLSRPNLDDLFLNLEPGEHRLGSDFNCEIVLIHPEVAPSYLTLKVGEESVAVLPEPGVSVTLYKHSVQDTILLKQGEWTPWHLGDRLVIADMSIEMDGLRAEEAPPLHISRGLVGRPVRSLFAEIVLVVLTVVASLMLPRGSESPALAHAGPQEAARTDLARSSVSVPQPAADAALVREKLAAIGANVENLKNENGKWTGTIRVVDGTARARVQEKIGGLRLPLSLDVYADRELAAAVEMTIANLGADTKVLGLKDGMVTLSAINDPELREKLVTALKSDVPGLGDVHFQYASPVDLAALAKRVDGIWPGVYPYVVLDNGEIVRVGETLEKDVKLIAIKRRHLVIEVNGQQKKVVLE